MLTKHGLPEHCRAFSTPKYTTNFSEVMNRILTLGKVTLLAATVMTAACAPMDQKGTEEKATPVSSQFQKFQEERPEIEALAIGDQATDLSLSAIAGIYSKTVKMTDAFITKTEAAPAFETLLKLREEKGDEAYQAELNALTAEDQKAYQEYLDSGDEMTKQAISLLPEALKLYKGLQKIDPKSIISNPLKLGGAMKAMGRAGDQMTFTMDALNMMKKYNDIYSNAKQYAGR